MRELQTRSNVGSREVGVDVEAQLQLAARRQLGDDESLLDLVRLEVVHLEQAAVVERDAALGA